MGITVPPALINGLIEGGTSALISLGSTLGLAHTSTPTPTPSGALSFKQSEWDKMDKATQTALLAGNMASGVHLIFG